MWGFAVTGTDGKPYSCSHIGIIKEFDYKCRDAVAKLMANGRDVDSAFSDVMNDEKLMSKHFTPQFTTQINTPACLAMSAPAFRETHGPIAKGGEKRKTPGDAEPTTKLTRSQRKARAKAKAAGQPHDRPRHWPSTTARARARVPAEGRPRPRSSS